MRNHFSKKNAGFTLIEVMVVISVIAVLTTVIVATLNTTKAQARDSKRELDTSQVSNALTAYSFDHNGVPAASVSTPGCSQSSTNPPVVTCTTSAAISATLQPLITGGYIPSLPTDPVNSGPYTYYYSTGPATTNAGATPIAPSGSFDYVSETGATSGNNFIILGTNAGAPDYTTYPITGYPGATTGTVTGGSGGTTAPGPSTGLSAQPTFTGSSFAFNIDPSELLAVASGPGNGQGLGTASVYAPKNANITLSWNAPSTGGTATNYAITRNGAPLANTSGTTYTDLSYALPKGSATTIQYTITASNSAGSASAETVNIPIPPTWVWPAMSRLQDNISFGGATTVSGSFSNSPAPVGTIYTLTQNGSTVGTMTVNSSGVATFSTIDTTPPYNITTGWEADLTSEPAALGN